CDEAAQRDSHVVDVEPVASSGLAPECDTGSKDDAPDACNGVDAQIPVFVGDDLSGAFQVGNGAFPINVDVEPVASSGLAPQCDTGSKDDAPDACNGVDAQIPVFVGDDLSGAFQVGNGAFPINVDDGPEPVTVDDEPLPLAAVDCEGRPIEICSQDSPDVTIVREVCATSSTRVSFLRPRVNNSPEVQITGETSRSKFDGSSYKTPETVLSKSRFNASLNSMSSMADGLYDEEGNLSNYEKCKRLNFDLGSTSQGKMDYLMRSYPVAKHEQYYESAKRSFKLAHDVLDLRRASLIPNFLEFFRAQHDGIFLMKYLELWDPCDDMLVKFTSRNILDIRLLYVVDMVLSKHNQLTDVKSLIEDYNTVLELKREQGMVQAQQEQQQRAQQEKQRAQQQQQHLKGFQYASKYFGY
ncbi:hypothetical protein EJB05_52104, partial [Eragrostis curvula]